MAEAKKTAKKTATKKTVSKKTASEPEAFESSKQETNKERRFELDDMIRCRSVVFGDLIYKGVNGIKYTWKGYGDIRELPYRDVYSLKSNRSKYLYTPWILIDDEELMATKEFSNEFGEIYEIYDEIESPREFFAQKPSVIKNKLADAPDGFKELIKHNARHFIDTGDLDSIGVINAIDEVLGTNLKMFL